CPVFSSQGEVPCLASRKSLSMTDDLWSSLPPSSHNLITIHRLGTSGSSGAEPSAAAAGRIWVSAAGNVQCRWIPGGCESLLLGGSESLSLKSSRSSCCN